MAMIGLFDVDMATYIHTPFNLELMKLSTFNKRRGHIPIMLPSLTDNSYDLPKIFVRKDYTDGVVPIGLRPDGSMELGGYALTGGTYQPMNTMVERCRADTTIYEKFRNEFSVGAKYKQIFDRMMNSAHGRLSLNGRTVWSEWEKQFDLHKQVRSIYLHDLNLQDIEGIKDCIAEIKSGTHKNASFSTKHSLILKDYEELLYWDSLGSAIDPISVRYAAQITDEELVAISQHSIFKRSTPHLFLQYIVTTGCQSQQDFVENRLVPLFLQVEYLRTHRQRILLNYEDGFFKDKRWERIIVLFNRYLSAVYGFSDLTFLERKEDISIYEFARVLRDPGKLKGLNAPFTKTELRALFYFVREKCPELFELFYRQTVNIELKGGKLVYE